MERYDDFKRYLLAKLPTIEDYLAAHLPASPALPQRDDLERYLFDPLAGFVRGGGKRIRPALALLGAEVAGGSDECALPVAAALELFQAAALIHDDIADRSELRRGKPCLHISEGVGLAINAGDGALIACTRLLLTEGDYAPELRLTLVDALLAMQERTLEGQALDLGWARDGRWDITVDDYLQMARLKTAYYTAAAPLSAGARTAGAGDELVAGLASFGLNAGLAFQIQDDLLNLTGDIEAQGKDYRSDITEGKRTLVMVWALAHASEHERGRLTELLTSATTDPARLEEAVSLAEATGAVDYARTYAAELTNRAKTELDALPIAKDAREVLRSMADFFVERGR